MKLGIALTFFAVLNFQQEFTKCYSAFNLDTENPIEVTMTNFFNLIKSILLRINVQSELIDTVFVEPLFRLIMAPKDDPASLLVSPDGSIPESFKSLASKAQPGDRILVEGMKAYVDGVELNLRPLQYVISE